MRTRLLLALILILTAALRIHTFPIPFERDEGEYAYAGQLMLQGIPPYSIACNMKLPGTYAAHALNMAIFGQSIAGVHAGLLVWNLGAIVLLFLVARRLFGDAGGLASAATYAWLSVGPSVMGTASHATQYVVPCAIAGLLVLLRSYDSSKLTLLFGSGLLFGLGFLMKQHGMFFGFFGALYIAWMDRTRMRVLLTKLAAFSAGAIVPFACTCLAMWLCGVFPKFWFWTFTYARAYTGQVGLGDGLTNFGNGLASVASDTPALFALAVVGLILVWARRKTAELAVFLTVFLGFSILAMSPGMYFREHYYVLMLPAVALFAGAGIAFAPARIRAPWPGVVFAVLMLASVVQLNQFFFRETPLAQSRDVWGDNPFPEAVPISKYIREHTQASTRIAVMGSEPEIYFYSHRHSATGYLYTYPLMEEQPYAAQMQQEMMNDITGGQPDYVVWVNNGVSWGRNADSNTRILDWWSAYWPSRFDVVGVADMLENHTEYRWDAAAAAYTIRSHEYMTILKRRT